MRASWVGTNTTGGFGGLAWSVIAHRLHKAKVARAGTDKNYRRERRRFEIACGCSSDSWPRSWGKGTTGVTLTRRPPFDTLAPALASPANSVCATAAVSGDDDAVEMATAARPAPPPIMAPATAPRDPSKAAPSAAPAIVIPATRAAFICGDNVSGSASRLCTRRASTTSTVTGLSLERLADLGGTGGALGVAVAERATFVVEGAAPKLCRFT